MKKYLETGGAAEFLTNVVGYPTSPKTLGKLASIGGGPVYFKRGNRRLYTEEHLTEWFESSLSGPISNTGCKEACVG